MMHYPDMMRLDLLIAFGGIFLDHDAFVIRPLDQLRSCCPPGGRGGACSAAPVVAGFEQATATLRKMNPGVLLAERGSPFLRHCRAGWRNYSTAWDYNCCEAAYAVHRDHPEYRSHLRADIGPLPRFATAAEYDEHIARARVVHVTALSKPWRQRDLSRFGVMRKVAARVLELANRSAAERGGMTPQQRECYDLTESNIRRRWGSS